MGRRSGHRGGCGRLSAGLRILAVGKLRAGPEQELVARYVKRIRPALSITEIAQDASVKREGAAMLAALPDPATLVALDAGGRVEDSEAFAARLQAWLEAGKPVCFAIGGDDGHDAAVLTRADHVLSFGAMIWPHMLARVMLVEQIFRARAIVAGHPYHRGR